MTRLFEAKPFIIAEVGSNWWHRFDTQDLRLARCIASINAAKECGADAVKFQAFDELALYGYHRLPIVESPEPYVLPLDWLPTLKSHADDVGIEFMCTAFSPELVAAVDPFVEVHKIASSDAAWPQMLDAVAATKKPLLLSMGGKSDGDLEDIWDHLNIAMKGRKRQHSVVWMYCVAAYPTDYVDLNMIETLREKTGCEVGFSDHTLGFTATVEAADCCAVAIEKHFTAFPDLDTPDRPHSLDPKQFKRMVDIIRGRDVEGEEQAMHLRHNRRLIATSTVEEGAPLVYGENYGAYRSTFEDLRGISPMYWEEVEGRRATRSIRRGEAIGEGDFA